MSVVILDFEQCTCTVCSTTVFWRHQPVNTSELAPTLPPTWSVVASFIRRPSPAPRVHLRHRQCVRRSLLTVCIFGRPSQIGWRPSLLGWRPSLVGSRPLLVETIKKKRKKGLIFIEFNQCNQIGCTSLRSQPTL